MAVTSAKLNLIMKKRDAPHGTFNHSLSSSKIILRLGINSPPNHSGKVYFVACFWFVMAQIGLVNTFNILVFKYLFFRGLVT